jgi:hypothetical protein
MVLRSDAVWAAIKQKGVVAMKADWTRRDPSITRALAGGAQRRPGLCALSAGAEIRPARAAAADPH